MRHQASKRYARAFMQIGVERNNSSLLQKQLNELAEIYTGSADFRAIIANPSIGIEERRKVLRTISQRSGWDPIMLNLALLLIDKDRIQYVAEISEEFQALLDAHEGNVRANVVSARPLNPTQVAGLKASISQLTGKNVLLTTGLDESLLGGAVTYVGNTVYDGSVRTQLNKIRESILEEV